MTGKIIGADVSTRRVPGRAPGRRQDPQAVRGQGRDQGLLEVPQRARPAKVRRQAEDWRRGEGEAINGVARSNFLSGMGLEEGEFSFLDEGNEPMQCYYIRRLMEDEL